MNRLTTGLIFMMLLLLGGAYFYLTKINPTKIKEGPVRIIDDFLPDQVSALFFEDLVRGTRASFKRTGPQAWQMLEPLVYPAEISALNAIMSPIQYNECTRVGKAEGLNLEDYGLSKPRVVLRLTFAGKEYEILLGEEDLSGDQIFIKVGEQILRTSRNLHNATQRTIKELRSPQIFSMPFASIREHEIHRGEQVLHFKLERNNWQMLAPHQERADAGAVNTLITSFLSQEVENFYDDHPGPMHLFGLHDPAYKIILRDGGGREEVLHIGFDDIGVLVGRMEGVNYVWELSQDIIPLVKFDAEIYRDHGFFRVFRDQIMDVRIGTQSGEMAFSKKTMAWRMVSPREYPVEKTAMEDVLESVDKLVADGFAPLGPKSLEDYGLEPASMWLQVQTRSGHPQRILIGKKDGEGRRYVRREDEDTALLVSEDLLFFVERSLLDFVSLYIYKLDEIDLKRVEVRQHEGETVKTTAWIRDDDNYWKKLNAEGNPGEEDKDFSSSLDYFLHWRGQKAVAENPNLFAFDAPALEIVYFNDPAGKGELKQVYSLPIVHDQEIGHLAKGRKNLVYSLDPRIIEKILQLAK